MGKISKLKKIMKENPFVFALAFLGIWNPYSLALAGWVFIARWINPMLQKSIDNGNPSPVLAGLLVGITYIGTGIYLLIKSVNFWI